MRAATIDREGREWVESSARTAGFATAGVAGLELDAASDLRFAEWVSAGHAGEMEWLKRVDDAGRLVRGDLRRSMPWARSVVMCAANYNAEAPRSMDTASETQGWIARYAWSGEASSVMGEPGRGTDYHDTLLAKLRSVEASIRERWPAAETRCYVDTGPMLERDLAARAGVGWIGKNACVLNQQLGSWLLLGVVVTSLEVAKEAAVLPAMDRCGSCTRCIDACPTDALLLPTPENPTRQMDATRCIAYLTIEKKGVIDEELRSKMGRQVFGCDICQDVCPWNRRAPVVESLPVRRGLVNPELEWLASMDGPTFNRWFRGSPLERTRRKRVLRNVAIAMGNSGLQEYVPRLEEWAAGEDEVLAEASRWALGQLALGERNP
ncbi:MAG: tRNA epoxyqueuosine(34) reductase QueG [Acidobacteriaceae bacterium]|nr:tRNA epoxyqueuosine(34) reductase QueG [Acidobacteriaceae bacterium]